MRSALDTAGNWKTYLCIVNVEEAFQSIMLWYICPVGGLPIVRHNEIRDITADWLNEICLDVEKEPQLQPLNDETILPRTANREDEAAGCIFWCKGFPPPTRQATETPVPALYRQHELGEKREYGDRIREIEHASFTPLIFSTTGGLTKEITVAYKRIAEMLALKRKLHYSITLTWMRCMLSFALIRCAVMANGVVAPRHIACKMLTLN